MCRTIMLVEREPIAMAAVTYSRYFTNNTYNQTVRTTGASIPMTIAMMTLFREEPSTAMMASTMIRPGTAIIASTTRCTTRSTARPAYAATTPTTNHAVTPITTAPSPTYSEIRAPWMTRLTMSRPTWSVPIG